MNSPNTAGSHYIETGHIEDVKYTQGHAITSGHTQGNEIEVVPEACLEKEVDNSHLVHDNGIQSPNQQLQSYQSPRPYPELAGKQPAEKKNLFKFW